MVFITNKMTIILMAFSIWQLDITLSLESNFRAILYPAGQTEWYLLLFIVLLFRLVRPLVTS